ncbi:hypothetical protein ACFWN2_28280 [Lentzea sp. NPDC058436]|uniref:hypothetical protein n=1 Tax=Lentzea sp. NPDC058436 TaxID=3346499 RepID=UPI00365AA578
MRGQVSQQSSPDPFWDFATQALPYAFALAVVMAVLLLNRGKIKVVLFRIFELSHSDQAEPNATGQAGQNPEPPQA